MERVQQQVLYNSCPETRYRNFLDWLCKTFYITDSQLRGVLFDGVQIPPNARVLFIGVGLGHEVAYLVKELGRTDLEIYSQDLSLSMIKYAKKELAFLGIQKIEMNVSNASNLPYKSNFFDLVFHFGGINFFSNRKEAISEMQRVAKSQGRVVFGDESVGQWLRNSDYGKMMINNNVLWSALPPLDELPTSANGVTLRFILENCFYLISWTKDPDFPRVNVDVKHSSARGG